MAGYLSLAAASCYDSHLSILRWGIDCPLSVQKKHGAQVPSHQLGSLQTWILISGLQFAYRLVWGGRREEHIRTGS